MTASICRWLLAWALLIFGLMVGQSCNQAMREDRFKPAQPSKALEAVRLRYQEKHRDRQDSAFPSSR